ncbi:MAG: HEPN domain-containing protein [Ginsengibacter sp.]|jgi:HEPN domain-containing protein|nr:HEPN domain-containing protein [Hanamia sp.]
MTKEEHVKYWKESADESWESALYLAKGKHFSLCLFALHLTLEKLLKALWIKESVTDTPPYTHDLQKLSEELQLDISPEDFDYLTIVNNWNIRGRYPDYTSRLNKKTTGKYLEVQIAKIDTIKKWLEEKISKKK